MILPRFSFVAAYTTAAAVLLVGLHPPQEIVGKEPIDGIEPVRPQAAPLLRAWIGGEITTVFDDGRLQRLGGAMSVHEGDGQWPVAGYLVLPGYGVVEVGAGGLDELSWLSSLPPNRVEDVESLHYVTVEEWEAAGAPGAR